MRNLETEPGSLFPTLPRQAEDTRREMDKLHKAVSARRSDVTVWDIPFVYSGTLPAAEVTTSPYLSVPRPGGLLRSSLLTARVRDTSMNVSITVDLIEGGSISMTGVTWTTGDFKYIEWVNQSNVYVRPGDLVYVTFYSNDAGWQDITAILTWDLNGAV